MNVLFAVHLYPPTHNCGGEYFIHNLSKFLISKGHTVNVLLYQAQTYGIKDIYVYEGVTVFPPYTNVPTGLFHQATHIVSHLEYTNQVWNLAHIMRKPFFFISHNSSHVYDFLNTPTMGGNIIYNSNWIKELLNYQKPSIVLHPPLSPDKIDANIKPEENEFITLINCNERKGGAIFKRIAEIMPERKFLCVKGSYDEQILPELPNVTIMDNSPDILPVYRKTRLLLMPSAYESYGMTATEAMANGIPVIALPTPGLKESCGDAGIFVDSDNLREWRKGSEDEALIQANHEMPAFNFVNDDDVLLFVKSILALDKTSNYFRMSAKCRARAAELDPRKELEAVENFMLNANS